MTNIYINAELSAELEELGVKPMNTCHCVGALVSTKRLTIFDLLYPENAEKVWGSEVKAVNEGMQFSPMYPDWQKKSEEMLELWWVGKGDDWQAFIKRSLERRKAEKG